MSGDDERQTEKRGTDCCLQQRRLTAYFYIFLIFFYFYGSDKIDTSEIGLKVFGSVRSLILYDGKTLAAFREHLMLAVFALLRDLCVISVRARRSDSLSLLPLISFVK